MISPKKIFGFSIVEVLISMMILGLGITAYVQSSVSNLATNTDTAESYKAAMVSAEVARVFAAHIAHLGPNASQSQIENAVRDLRSDLLNRYEALAKKRGYVCDKYIPRVTDKSTVNPAEIRSTLEHLWLVAPPGCLVIHVKDSETYNVKGVWIESKLTWLSLKDTIDDDQRAGTTALISPM